MGRCRVPDCGGITEYDESAQAVLCTTCGTVTTQEILTHDWSGETSGSSLYFGPTTLKSLRRVGGGLVGQSSREDRDRRNTAAMHQYILGVTAKVGFSSVVLRSQTLFDQVKARTKFRWGKKAILVAGACINIALREYRLCVTISRLASVMDVSPYSLCRVFAQVRTLLNVQVRPFDPMSVFPDLQSHLVTLSTSPTASLPKKLITVLQTLPPIPVLHLATSLASLLHETYPFSPTEVSTCPTACALFIIAMEGRAAFSLPSYARLAQELGATVGARKDLVIERYREISKILGEWITEVPWLSGANDPDNMLGKKRRKISQRDTIAMGIKDLVQFREDILRARKDRQETKLVKVALEVAEGSEDSGSDDDEALQSGRKRKRSDTPCFIQPSGGLRLIRSRKAKPSISRMDLATLSLLSPLHPFTANPHSSLSSKECHLTDALQNQILTSPTFPAQHAATRLQELAAIRGGEAGIEDNELFEPGELEGYLRDEEGILELRKLLEWNDLDAGIDTRVTTPPTSSQVSDWGMADIGLWEDMGGGKNVDGEEYYSMGEYVEE